MTTITKEVHEFSGQVSVVGMIINNNTKVWDGDGTEVPSEILNNILNPYKGRKVKVRIEVIVEEIVETNKK